MNGRVGRACLLCKACRSDPPRPPPVRPLPALSRSPRVLPPTPRPPARRAPPAVTTSSEACAHEARAPHDPYAWLQTLADFAPPWFAVRRCCLGASLPARRHCNRSSMPPLRRPLTASRDTVRQISSTHMPLSVGLSVGRPRAAAPATSISGIWFRTVDRSGSGSPCTTPPARPVHLRRHRTWRARGVRMARAAAHAVTTATASTARRLDPQLLALPNLRVRP